jgi:beta-lactamase regulating signal transducer with metallopeptidase domain
MMSGEFFQNAFLWSCLWQSVLCLAAGLVCSIIFRRRPSRAHGLLLMGMMAAVLVPLMSATVKHLELGLFAAEPTGTQSERPARAVREYEPANHVFFAELEPEPSMPEEGPAPATTVRSYCFDIPWRQAGLWAWAAASMVLVLRLVVTFFCGLRLLAKATPLACMRIQKAMFLAKAKLGINRPVSVRQSGRVRSPVIWCWARHPILLLPTTALEPDNSSDWVGIFCHELAHWKRSDYITGLFAELQVCALAWNPLAWWAKRRLVRLSEQACDDWVLASGQVGTDYAESLLELTPQGQMAFAPAVASSRSGLARRVLRILQDKCSNPRTGMLWATVVTIMAGMLVTAIAFAQTRPATTGPGEGRIEGTVVHRNSGQGVAGVELAVVPTFSSAESVACVTGQDGSFSAGGLQSGQYVITGSGHDTYVDVEPGRTISGVIIYHLGERRSAWTVVKEAAASATATLEVIVTSATNSEPLDAARVSFTNKKTGEAFKVLTDANGIARTNVAPGDYAMTNVSKKLYRSTKGDVQMTVAGGGTECIDIQLGDAPKVTGYVRGLYAKPISGAVVTMVPYGPRDIVTDHEGKFEFTWDPRGIELYLVARQVERGLAGSAEFHSDIGEPGHQEGDAVEIRIDEAMTLIGKVVDVNGKGISAAKVAAVIHTGLDMPAPVTEVLTDADGRYEIKPLPPGHFYVINTTAQGYGTGWTKIAAFDAAAGSVEAESMVLRAANLLVSGVVVDANGAPVKGAMVKCWGSGQPEVQTLTDAAGKFTIENICKGELRIYAKKGELRVDVVTAGGTRDLKMVLPSSEALRRAMELDDAKALAYEKKRLAAEREAAEAEAGLIRPPAQQVGPRITFESETHDFGQVSPGSKSAGEFKFTNTGDAVLKVKKIKTSCGCTVARLTKKEYAPGESGTITVTYSASKSPGKASKRVNVPTNDMTRPRIPLTVKATIAFIVQPKPERLKLLLKAENAGCGEITLTSRDGRPFGIKGVSSTANCITAEFDPAVQATEFTLKPKADVTKLKTLTTGQIRISLTHPKCKMVTIALSVLKEFKISPTTIVVSNAEPNRAIKRKLSIVSNYNEDFEIESTRSQKNIVKVLSQKRGENRYTLELEITPPTADDKKKMFRDVFHVSLSGGQRLEVPCRGIYRRTKKQLMRR